MNKDTTIPVFTSPLCEEEHKHLAKIGWTLTQQKIKEKELARTWHVLVGTKGRLRPRGEHIQQRRTGNFIMATGAGRGAEWLVARKRCRMASRKDAQIVSELHHLKHSPEKNFILLSPEKLKTWQSTHSLIIDHIPSPQLPIHLPLFCTKQRKGDHPHYTIRHKYTMVTKIRHHASQ